MRGEIDAPGIKDVQLQRTISARCLIDDPDIALSG